ncbi:hypothetical protein CAAN1_01S03906 [[Candida] anglica]|uniref:Uncharacterized protein n=1 Tax=[Candida] anglica TaxID=148631 RepID=A0ABP0EJG4_9ASCO
MSYKETLCYQLCQLILGAENCTIGLIPETTECFLTHLSEDGKCIEIGIPKKTFLKIFKESHSYWHSVNAGDISLNTYYCTFGYLLTTNENHSIIRLHEVILLRMLSKATEREKSQILLQEFKIIIALLTSRLKKINKSSSLWLWLRKLSITMVFNPLFNGNQTADAFEKFKILIDSAIKACELHFSNYYAASSLRWFIRMVYNHNYELEEYAQQKLIEACHRHLTDSSLWSVLGLLVNEPEGLDYAIEEYNSFVDQISPHISGIQKIQFKPDQTHHHHHQYHRSDTSGVSQSQTKWLLAVKCTIFTPYISILSNESYGLICQSIELEKEELKSMKEKNLCESYIYETSKAFVDTLERVCNKYNGIMHQQH